MLNTSSCIVNLDGMEANFMQMSALEVATKTSLANATEVIFQLMTQTGKDQLRVKTERIEVIAFKDKVMFITKDIKLVSTLEDFADMNYDLRFSLHKQSTLLDAILELGYMLETGKLVVDSEVKSDGRISIPLLVLNKLNAYDKKLNVIFSGCKISVKENENEVLINNKLIYQNGVLYFDEYYCKVLLDLFSKIMTNHKYDVLYK